MKKILCVFDSRNGADYQRILDGVAECSAKNGYFIEQMDIGRKTTIPCEMNLQKTDAEYLISLDMAGFQYKTLLDNFLYHIIAKKQLHLITDESIWEKNKNTVFAMNQIVYIPNNDVTCIQNITEEFNVRYYPGKQLLEKTLGIEMIFEDFLNVIK